MQVEEADIARELNPKSISQRKEERKQSAKYNEKWFLLQYRCGFFSMSCVIMVISLRVPVEDICLRLWSVPDIVAEREKLQINDILLAERLKWSRSPKPVTEPTRVSLSAQMRLVGSSKNQV